MKTIMGGKVEFGEQTCFSKEAVQGKMFKRKIVDYSREVKDEGMLASAAARDTMCLAKDDVTFELRGEKAGAVWVVC